MNALAGAISNSLELTQRTRVYNRGTDRGWLLAGRGLGREVATKALSDPDERHPVAKHLPETMSIEFGVMYH